MTGRKSVAIPAAALAALVAIAAIAAFTLPSGPDPARAQPVSAPTTSTPVPDVWHSAGTAGTAGTVGTAGTAGTAGEPVRLSIPSIEVDATIIDVGTTADDGQEVPDSLDDTGWWRDGVRPGSPGNAVIVGHTASVADGVFDDLEDTRPGDEIVVEGEDGATTFRVVEVEEVAVRNFATVADDVYRTDGPSGLVLMTCGDWNGQTFETTVIVHAEAGRHSTRQSLEGR